MNLKLSTLIAIIGQSIGYIYWLLMWFTDYLYANEIIGQVIGLLSRGSLVLFLVVLYFKQKKG